MSKMEWNLSSDSESDSKKSESESSSKSSSDSTSNEEINLKKIKDKVKAMKKKMRKQGMLSHGRTRFKVVRKFSTTKKSGSSNRPSTSSAADPTPSNSAVKNVVIRRVAFPQYRPRFVDKETQTDDTFLQRLREPFDGHTRLRSELTKLLLHIQSIKEYWESLRSLGKKVEAVQKAYRDRLNNTNNESLNNSELTSSNTSKVSSNISASIINISTSTSNTDTNQTTLTSEMSESEETDDVKPESSGKMIPIGTGRTLIPEDIYYKIRWDKYALATRKLLMAVFSRKILATHSLSGKPSNAASSTIPKLQLDPVKINDIIMAVTIKCRVSANVVRIMITNKCCDENKLYKIRLKRKRDSLGKLN